MFPAHPIPRLPAVAVAVLVPVVADAPAVVVVAAAVAADNTPKKLFCNFYFTISTAIAGLTNTSFFEGKYTMIRASNKGALMFDTHTSAVNTPGLNAAILC